MGVVSKYERNYIMPGPACSKPAMEYSRAPPESLALPSHGLVLKEVWLDQVNLSPSGTFAFSPTNLMTGYSACQRF